MGRADRPGPLRRPLSGKRPAASTLVAYLSAFLRFPVWCDGTGWADRPDVHALEFALIDWMSIVQVSAYIGNFAFGVLSPRIHGELVDARALLSDWNDGLNAAYWPPLPHPLFF